MAKEASLKWSIIILPFLRGILCSVGDNSPFYNHCVKNCKIEICDAGKNYIYHYNILGYGFSLWSCLENCEYECQWKTVEAFQRKKWLIPQFKGKWPFIRLFGLQEPASVFFSVVNFIVMLKLLVLFRKKVSKLSPYYYVWFIFGLLQLNCWFWSAVYHTRDIDVTEKLDYMSAFLVVLYSFYGVGLRYISSSFEKKTVLWSLFCGFIGINHLSYLWFFNFDYSFNMKLNIMLGGLTLIMWILWSFFHFHSQFYVWKIFLFAISTGTCTLLEVIDFPPVFWIFDSHALWHGCSIFLNILFYLFLIDDCNYLNDLTEKLLTSQKRK